MQLLREDECYRQVCNADDVCVNYVTYGMHRINGWHSASHQWMVFFQDLFLMQFHPERMFSLKYYNLNVLLFNWIIKPLGILSCGMTLNCDWYAQVRRLLTPRRNSRCAKLRSNSKMQWFNTPKNNVITYQESLKGDGLTRQSEIAAPTRLTMKRSSAWSYTPKVQCRRP